MVFDEVIDIVNDISDGNESFVVFRLVDKVILVDNGELFERGILIEGSMFLVEFFLELLNMVFFDFVGVELFEVVGEVNLFLESDSLFGGIVLLLFNGVVVVGWEFVVEVVVIFIESDEGSDEVVMRRVVVIEGLVIKLVGKGVDVESSLLDEVDMEDVSVDIIVYLVVLVEVVDKSWEDDCYEDNVFDEVVVLLNDDGVFVEIGDIGLVFVFGVLFYDYLVDVRVEEIFVNGVRVFVGVGVMVVSVMVVRLLMDRVFYGIRVIGSEKDF